MTRPRIISGIYKGRSLSVAKATRPLTDRIKVSMFGLLGEVIDGSSILDAYAGTGAFGLEALSRGAAKVTFVEADDEAVKLLKDTFIKLEIPAEHVSIYEGKIQSFVAYTKAGAEFDLIFMDPPFPVAEYIRLKQISKLIKPGGVLILRLPIRAALPPDLPKDLVELHKAEYGDSKLLFWQRRV
jgi:16S rRNA (guanine966-N2)-methyltransferase